MTELPPAQRGNAAAAAVGAGAAAREGCSFTATKVRTHARTKKGEHSMREVHSK